MKPGLHRSAKGSENPMDMFFGEHQRNEFEPASKPFFFISKSKMPPTSWVKQRCPRKRVDSTIPLKSINAHALRGRKCRHTHGGYNLGMFPYSNETSQKRFLSFFRH